jgi:hypothetical protein
VRTCFLLLWVGGSLGPEGWPAKRKPSPEGLGHDATTSRSAVGAALDSQDCGCANRFGAAQSGARFIRVRENEIPYSEVNVPAGSPARL